MTTPLLRIGCVSAAVLLCVAAAAQESRAAELPDAPLPQWKPLEHPSRFAAALCYVGDVDADGTGDLAVGGPNHKGPSDNWPGCVWIVSGSTGKCIRKLEPPADSPRGTGFGKSLASLGDLDGDGIVELGVGAISGAGNVGVFSLRDGALRAWLAGEAPNDLFGWSLCSLGDLDCDGVSDFAVGAPQGHGYNAKPGYVRVQSGRDGSILRTWSGTRAEEGFGTALCSIGDVDSDGAPDVAIAAPCPYTSSNPQSGRVVVLSAREGRVLREFTTSHPGSRLGSSLCAPGDLNGDGRTDVLIAELGQSHAARGIFGRSVRAYSVMDGVELHRAGAPRGMALTNGDFGSAVSALGDIDGDKVPDYLVSCQQEGELGEGAAWALSGATGRVLQAHAVPTQGGGVGAWYYGESISRAGDIDHDEVDDIAVGMCSWYSPAERQWVLIYSGKTGRRLAVYQEREIDASPTSAPAAR